MFVLLRRCGASRLISMAFSSDAFVYLTVQLQEPVVNTRPVIQLQLTLGHSIMEGTRMHSVFSDLSRRIDGSILEE